MALIKCAECGKEISDKANACPGCGCPINIPIEISENNNVSTNIKIEKNDNLSEKDIKKNRRKVSLLVLLSSFFVIFFPIFFLLNAATLGSSLITLCIICEIIGLGLTVCTLFVNDGRENKKKMGNPILALILALIFISQTRIDSDLKEAGKYAEQQVALLETYYNGYNRGVYLAETYNQQLAITRMAVERFNDSSKHTIADIFYVRNTVKRMNNAFDRMRN